MSNKPWSKTIRFLAHTASGVCTGAIGLLFWTPLNWRFWVFLALVGLILANEEVLAEGRPDESEKP